MSLLQHDWEQNNLTQVAQLLEDTRDYPKRDFEWYYWQRQLHRSRKTFRGHLDRIGDIAVSLDGRRFATASSDRTIKVWDIRSGEEFTLAGHTAWVRSVAFFPDGKRILSSSDDLTTRVWDVASRRELMVIPGHTSHGLFSALSPDGRLIVTGGWDRKAKIWDADSGELRRELDLETKDPIWAVSFSSDGKRVAVGGGETVRVQVLEGEGEPIQLKHARVNCIDFSRDGNWVVTGSKDNTAKVWDSDGRHLDTLDGHKTWVWSAAFSPDSKRIVTTSGDRTAKVWDWNGERATEALQLRGHRSVVWCAAFLPDGQRLLTGSQDGTARLWDVTVSEPHVLQHIDKKSASPIVVASVAFLRDGERIVSGGYDGVARLWNVETRRVEREFDGHGGRAVVAVAAEQKGEWIVTGGEDGTANVWDVATAQTRFKPLAHNAAVKAVSVSPDGQWIATGSADRTVKLWNALDGTFEKTLAESVGEIRSIAFSPDNRLIVASSAGSATAWNVATGAQGFSLPGPDQCLAISRSGQLVMAGTSDKQDGRANVWDLSTSPPKKSFPLKGHGGLIWSACFSLPEGRRIVTAAWDHRVKVWDASIGRELLTLTGHRHVRAVAFSANGKRIATAGADGTVRVWTAASKSQVAAWQKDEREAERKLQELERKRQEADEHEYERLRHDEGAVKHWLVLGPIQWTAEPDEVANLDQEQIKEEAQLEPIAGDAVLVGNRTMTWRDESLEDHEFDLGSILGPDVGRAVAYAVCYIHAENAHHGLRLITHNQDPAKIYLNGQEVYKRTARSHGLRDTVVNLRLKAGVNVFVLKSVSSGGSWPCSLRLTHEEGNPVRAIKALSAPTVLAASEVP